MQSNDNFPLVFLIVTLPTFSEFNYNVVMILYMSMMEADAESSLPNSLFTSQTKQDPVTITQVLPTHINIYTYTIKHRDTFTTDQSKHFKLMSTDHKIKYLKLNRKLRHCPTAQNNRHIPRHPFSADNFMTIIKY